MGTQVFTATLSGTQETPPNASTATGTGTFVLNAAGTQLSFSVSYSGLTGTATAAHFHNGPVGVAGTIVRDMAGPFTSPSGTFSGTWSSTDGQPLTPFLVSELRAGRIYFNIHTSPNFAGGEIRGQLQLQSSSSSPSSASTVTNGNGNEVQSLSLSGAPGNFALALNGVGGVLGTTDLAYAPAFNEVQQLSFSGGVSASTSQFHLGFTTDGVNYTYGSDPLTYVAGISPTADDVTAYLGGGIIPALYDSIHQQNNFTVSGPAGGPFNITFTGQLAGQNVFPLSPLDVTGGTPSGVRSRRLRLEHPLYRRPPTFSPTSCEHSVAVRRLVRKPADRNGDRRYGGPFLIAFGGGLAGYNLSTLSTTATAGTMPQMNAVSGIPADGGGSEIHR